MNENDLIYLPPSANSSAIEVEGKLPLSKNRTIKATDILNYISTIRVAKSFNTSKRTPFLLSDNEVFVLLKMSGSEILGHSVIGIGTSNEVMLDRKMLMQELYRKVKGRQLDTFIVCHNHPNASYLPTPNDCYVTRIICGMELLTDFRFMEHFIVGPTTMMQQDEWTNYYRFGTKEDNKLKTFKEEVYQFFKG